MMPVISLVLIFGTVIVTLMFKRPLWQAVTAGIAVIAVLYRMGVSEIVQPFVSVVTDSSCISVLLSLYLITFLQRILTSRNQIRLAQDDLNRLFHNRRINIAGACLFIGLLPSAASMLLCAELVRDMTDGYLKPEDQAFVSSWIRHVPESCLPTYSGVLLMLSLSGVSTSSFMACMVIPVLFLIGMAWFVYLRKIPADLEGERSRQPFRECVSLFSHLWSLILILVLILVFHMQVVTSVLISILICIPVYHVTWNEIRGLFVSAFEKKLLCNTFLVLVLKEFLVATGILTQLPETLSVLPLPTWMIFGILFFLATVISGSTASIAMGTPLAFAAIPDGGTALMVFLMCMSHAASQLSPTHICLSVASDSFGIPLGKLIRKTLPFSIAFITFMCAYYMILGMLGV